MIRWCAYCQKFLGESPPIENKSFSHGICVDCVKIGLPVSDQQRSRLKFLVDLNSRFWTAGSAEDHDSITRLAREAIREGIRPIDILFGFAGPMLFRVGEMWENKIIDCFEEARFTRTVETLVELVAQQIHLDRAEPDLTSADRVLLTNVFGNEHSLGIKFVRIGIASLGIPATVLLPAPEPSSLVAKVIAEKFQIIGLSIALSSQIESLQETLKAFKAEKSFTGKLLIGGPVVDQKMIDANEYSNVRFLLSPSFSEAERIFWTREPTK